jgi:hypothetical protein
VIGRLVEQQQVRLTDQRTRQQDAPLPASGQRVDDRVGRKRQARHHHVRLVLALPFVMLVKLAETFTHHGRHGTIRGQRYILDEPGDAHAGLSQHRTGIRGQIAAQDLQQRRLAAAVAADYGNALPRIDLEIGFIEQWQMSKREGNTVERDERHRTS